MKLLDLFSGVGTASIAAKMLGMEVIGHAEIDPHACKILEYHFPEISNYGDVTNVEEWPQDLDPDIIVGGFPCQDFSIAGKREGTYGKNGKFAWAFVNTIDKYRPKWFVGENVLGLLTSRVGEDFKTLLEEIQKLGYSVGWRVLDTQCVGVYPFVRGIPQRRKRVYLVGHFSGDPRFPLSVLYQQKSSEESKRLLCEKGKEIGRKIGEGYEVFTPKVANTLAARMGRGFALGYHGGQTPVVLKKDGKYAIRKLTPEEAEKLQGLPEGWTNVGLANTNRYKVIGNAMSLNVILYVLTKIIMAEEFSNERRI